MRNGDPTNTPDQWLFPEGDKRWVLKDERARIYIALLNDPTEADDLHRLWVVHWHEPTDKPARWQIAGLGNHTLHSLDPLHLEPSLGCNDGCPSHGWVRDGKWVSI